MNQLKSDQAAVPKLIVVHGGAGVRPEMSMAVELQFLAHTLCQGHDMLHAGATAVEIAASLVETMEDSGLFIAGRGATPDSSGHCEMDAALVDGEIQRAGAVAALRGFQNPIRVAQAVMRDTQHVLLAGAGAEKFASERGCRKISVASDWYKRAGSGEANHAGTVGTVGCCVRDMEGRLAAASSTAGLFDKIPGRVSDTAVVGGGVWCDRNIAACCTGQGDYFIRSAATATLAAKIHAGNPLATAMEDCLNGVQHLGGWGGMIALDRQGQVALQVRQFGMKCGILSVDGNVHTAVVRPYSG